jgi:predicted nucleic acid-binding protein
MAIRRGRCDLAFRHATLIDLSQLPIHLDPETDAHAWDATSQLAHRHRLSVYDAAYLELAIRRDVPLATLDSALRIAARAESVELLGL